MTEAMAQGAQPEATTPETTQQASAVEKRKIKIDGIEQEVDVDSVLKDYQKYQSADKRFKEAAAMRGEAEKIRAMLNKAQTEGDLADIVNAVGEEKFRKFVEPWLWEKIQYEQLPEEKREAIESKRKAETAEAELKRLKEEREREQVDAQKAQAYQEIDREISEAIKGLGRKPTPRLIARLAETMAASLSDEDASPLDAKSALQKTVAEMDSDLTEYVAQLSADELIQRLPKETLDAIRKSLVAQAQTQAQATSRARSQAEPQKPQKPPRRMTTDEYFKNLERRIG